METLDVVAAVIIDRGRILACRRRVGTASGGLWEFPGGKIESGESAQAALAREIREELGVSLEVEQVLTVDETQVGALRIRLQCFRAALRDARPDESTDHDHLVWLLPSELPGLDWAQPDLPAVRLLSSAER
ncbi:(deoxy)nucleoside triphosphate pyrophosphohydrolase [Rathayibacter tritici]|uniref:(deoxy)nucleoside triphosphate pyrophosphohydrolase n=1 Tax=Rathayibacter tritici TaxID=33888 RepID=UPI0009FD26E5|nr:(deoxy)nucleoside triphosphate pyrophosphohydrolase [Rathayibacter tritici]PPF29910.1 (deoxy)nucleoside triphosphate pyrophosphohydrolase [Rathayibacter tritici]PPF65276.1 (deoxy)nucleoside triphosphate pyrophosphohydrolase [Rathayibacter tritici]PPG06032.1 (deoxy)nucleoside triphosphate pyrophosphohydrolase [Rathayibacter tritici]PPI19920.1 (deoxy)nucleoside triphosphate pyrophosphohydrolase [Rathayibacter tritici]PPI50096.1 (deoxy)nucleoside triphosphate pyrophosphohydrolase [Rathayibacte